MYTKRSKSPVIGAHSYFCPLCTDLGGKVCMYQRSPLGTVPSRATCLHASGRDRHWCLCQLLHYFSRHSFLLKLESSNSARLASQQVLRICLSPIPQHWDDRHHVPLSVCTGDLNPGPHSCMRSTLMIEPSFQSQLVFWDKVCLGNLGLANQVRQVIHWAR